MTLCEACASAERTAGTWGPDGTIVFAQVSSNALQRVPSGGGPLERLAAGAEDEASRLDEPHFLPDGRAVLLTVLAANSPTAERNIEVLDLRSGKRKLVHGGGRTPKYLSTGHLTFVREGRLFAAPFDLDRLELTAAPVPLVDGIAYSRFGHAHYSVSQTGLLVYVPAKQGERAGQTVAWVTRHGTISPLGIAPGNYYSLELSPDDAKLALDQDSSIWVHDLTRGGRSRLSSPEEREWSPVWSHDGVHVSFGADRSGRREIHWRRADGTGPSKQLTMMTTITEGGTAWPTSWSPDGRTLAFTVFGGDSLLDIWTLSFDDTGKPGSPVVFANTPFHERDAVFSPDGAWVAYMSLESGKWEIYVRPFPEGEGREKVSTEGGWNPRWAEERHELYYQEGERIMVVPYAIDGDRFRAEAPRPLLSAPLSLDPNGRSFDAASDGERFIVLLRDAAERTRGAQLVMVLDWFEELKRLVPTE